MWILASQDYPNLGLQDIMEFAAALTGVQYDPRVLAFLEAALIKMMSKRWSKDLAMFCWYGLELLLRSDAWAASRLREIVEKRITPEDIDDTVVMGLEHLVGLLLKGRSYGEPRGLVTAPFVKIPFKLTEGVLLGPYNGQLIVVSTAARSDVVFIRPVSELQVVANLEKGTYVVFVRGVPVEGATWKFEGTIADGYAGIMASFPDVEVRFEEAE
jgi:hypothetical protein